MSKLLNHTKNRTLVCLHNVRSTLLFLVLVVNSNRFKFYVQLHALTQAACSYVLLCLAVV